MMEELEFLPVCKWGQASEALELETRKRVSCRVVLTQNRRRCESEGVTHMESRKITPRNVGLWKSPILERTPQLHYRTETPPPTQQVKPELPVQSDGMVIAPECTQEVYHAPEERLPLRGNLTCLMQKADKGLQLLSPAKLFQ